MIAMYSPAHRWHYVNDFKERFAKGSIAGSERLGGLLSWKERCKEKDFCIIVLDALSDHERKSILEGFRGAPFHLRVIWTEGGPISLPAGVTNVTQEAVSWEELSAKGQNPHIAFLREKYRDSHSLSCSLLVGESKVMEDLRQTIVQAGKNLDAISPLLVGETGTGKNLAAKLINEASPNRGIAMVSVNCSRLSDDVGKVMLFGSVPGAFTGAVAKQGILGEADGKTLFLDEMQTMNMATQGELLDVVETHTFRKLGETRLCESGFSLVSAMNEDPYLLMERGLLREDLFHRIAGEVLFLPPLRAHKEDIPLLLQAKTKSRKPIASSLLERMNDYNWPGNVREFESFVRKVEVFSREKDFLDYPPGPINPRKGCPWPMHRLSTDGKTS